jgi:hypothetical protein
VGARGRHTSLLESLQALIERTYRMETGIADVGRFVIGDDGYRRFYGPGGRYGEPAPRVAGGAREAGLGSGTGRTLAAGASGPGGGIGRSLGAGPSGPGGRPAPSSCSARVLVHDSPGSTCAHLYYPDALIRVLEDHPPTMGLREENIDPFATFIEELDHLLLIAERSRLERPVSLLELELHANVTKYLVCYLFLESARRGARGADLAAKHRVWLHWHLFEKALFTETEPDVRERYRAASRFAVRFLAQLEEVLDPGARLARLRGFHDSLHYQKVAALA